jgi:hypothetical protein
MGQWDGALSVSALPYSVGMYRYRIFQMRVYETRGIGHARESAPSSIPGEDLVHGKKWIAWSKCR